MPRPKSGETKEAYVSRFMSSEEARSDYPVAYSMWEHRNATGDDGWPKLYSCTFIEPGVVFYDDLGPKGETILVQKPALDKMAMSFIGKPVINLIHKDVDPKTVAKGEADGIVSRVWFDDVSGWYKCEFLVWDELTQRNCESEGTYSVSCAYEPTDVNSNGGSYHNMPYQEEVLDGFYTHLAVVPNPRYEGARIFVNSKGGSEMSWKFWASKATKKNAADLDPEKTVVNVDGEKVSLKQLYDAVKPGETTLEMSDDTVLEVDGKEHTLGSLKSAYGAKMKAAKDDEDKKLANDQAEKAAKEEADKAKAKETLEREQAVKNAKDKEDAEKKNAADAEAKKKEDEEKEKKNAADEAAKKEEEEKRNAGKASFAGLKNAARSRSGEPVGINMITPEERLAAGKAKYGSAPTH